MDLCQENGIEAGADFAVQKKYLQLKSLRWSFDGGSHQLAILNKAISATTGDGSY